MSNGRAQRIIKEIVNTVKYTYRSLSLSMRRRISFDYLVMYVIVSIITIVVFLMSYNLVQVKEKNDELMDYIYHLALIREQGTLNEVTFTRQIDDISREEGLGIRIEMRALTGNMPVFQVQTDYVEERVYDMRYVENVWLFFSKGMVKKTESFQYQIDEDNRVVFNVQIVQNFSSPTNERKILLIALMASQIIGVTIMSIVGSYRLKKVFMPVFAMTKAAEKITINDMDARLDVSRAEYELKDLANTFNDMIERIRLDYVKQKRFVSDVSHELRTPISIVNGYARMLDRWGKNDPEILEESIEAIKSESKNMHVLVENLLTLVRSDNLTLEFEREKFNLDEMGKELIRDCQMIDEGKHSFDYYSEGSMEVCLDYAKVMQTLRIFLDNAIKYTPEGGKVTLSISKAGKFFEVAVTDTGIGIHKSDLPHLFERFYRSDESRTRETGGHGLGLAIAKAMIIGQKGIIKVKSKVNEGSTFIITLPLSCDDLRDEI